MEKVSGEQLITGVDLEQLKDSIGKSTTFSACVHKVREMSGFSFILLRTGRYVIQSVYLPDQCTDDISEIKEGCYVTVIGDLRADERSSYGFELVLTSVKLLSRPYADYPVKVWQKRLGCTLDTNLQYRSVALRNPYERAIFKITEGVVSAFREFLIKQGFTEIHSPKIVAAGAEGGANIFKLKYFDREAFLAQSPQFYKQTCVAFFDRVFEIGPVFRAERHNTSRHLNEYTGLDFEMGFIDSMYDVMNMEIAMLRYVMDYLKEHYAHELEITGTQLPEVGEIPSFTFAEALELLRDKDGKNKNDLDPEDEVKLCNYAKEHYGSEFVFVTHFPSAKRPFYAMDDPNDSKLALSFDLLFRGLEITTGGQRIHDYNQQIEKMMQMGLDPEHFSSYLDIHKYGMPPHGGLGIGLERLVMKLLDLKNVRRASLFPRDLNHIDP